jgi:hypothetical protein
MQTIFEKCPFKENGKLLKLFCLILRGLNLPVGSDTPQNKILRGIRRRRTRSCGVSDPAEPSLAGHQVAQNNDKDVCIFSRRLFCGVWYPTEHRPAGSDTLPNKILQGVRPCGTKFCGVSHPREQLYIRIFPRIRHRFQKYFRVWIRGLYGFKSWKKLEVENLMLLSL